MSRFPLLCRLFLFAVSPALFAAAPAPRLVFSPAEWKFGMIAQGSVIETQVTVTNLEPVTVTVTLFPTCSCNRVIPGSQTIPSGSHAGFSVRYDSTDDVGITTKSLLARTDLPGAPVSYYLIRGTVRQVSSSPAAGGAGTRQPPEISQDTGRPAVPAASLLVTYYYTPGCRSCEE